MTKEWVITLIRETTFMTVALAVSFCLLWVGGVRVAKGIAQAAYEWGYADGQLDPTLPVALRALDSPEIVYLPDGRPAWIVVSVCEEGTSEY